MKRKNLLTKMLLAVALMGVGVNASWADGTLRTLNSQNYELADATDWTGTVSLGTGDATYGKYAICNPASGANRGSYKAITLNTAWGINNGYTTTAMITKGYNVEFDLQLSSGNVKGRSQSQFFVMTSSRTETGYAAYSGSDYIFGISQPTRTDDSETDDGKTIGYDTNWFVNDLEYNSTPISLTRGKWYHVKLVVSATSVDYTITDNSTSSVITNGTGAKTVESLPSIWGFWTLAARGYGSTYFDNLEIYNYSDLPTATYAWGQNYVGLVASDVTMSTTDDATFSNGVKNTYVNEMYGIPSTDGGTSMATDGRIAFEVNTTKPKKWILRPTSKGNGIYNFTSGVASVHIYTLTKGQLVKVMGSSLCTGSGVLTALTDYDDGTTRFYQVNADGVGILSAGKYIYIASIEIFDFDNEIIGLMDKSTAYTSSIGSTEHKDLTISKGETLSINFNNHGNGENNYNNWALRIVNSGAGFDRTLCAGNHINGTDAYTNVTQLFEMDGSTVSFEMFMTDYKTQMMDANVDMTITYTSAGMFSVKAEASGSDHTYTYTMTYGVAFTGDVTMELGVDCAWLEILSTERTVSKSISAAGWATYCSPYALDLENATNLTDAYIVTGGAGGVLTKTSVKGGTVPANTGLLLKGEGECVIPVVASSTTDVSSNILTGVTSATEIAAETGWVLMGSPSLGFYKNTNAFTVGANTAYIPLASLAEPTAARGFYSLFGDETTGIGSVNSEEITDKSFYDLQGRRVAQPAKGLYIVNGKKVVVK